MRSVQQVTPHLRGAPVPGIQEYPIEITGAVDVAGIRGSVALSQAAFVKKFGLDVSAVQAREQGLRRPGRTARILLPVIAGEPEAVLRALRGSASRRAP